MTPLTDLGAPSSLRTSAPPLRPRSCRSPRLLRAGSRLPHHPSRKRSRRCHPTVKESENCPLVASVTPPRPSSEGKGTCTIRNTILQLCLGDLVVTILVLPLFQEPFPDATAGLGFVITFAGIAIASVPSDWPWTANSLSRRKKAKTSSKMGSPDRAITAELSTLRAISFWTATKAILQPCVLLLLLGVLCDHALISCLPALGLWLALMGTSLASSPATNEQGGVIVAPLTARNSTLECRRSRCIKSPTVAYNSKRVARSTVLAQFTLTSTTDYSTVPVCSKAARQT
jgi:hypothetical protein